MAKPQQQEKWSAEVTQHRGALDLEPNIFESKDPKKIAQRRGAVRRPPTIRRQSVG